MILSSLVVAVAVAVTPTEFTVERPDCKLAGELLVPARGKPPSTLAIVIAGSGPTDRDGNSKLGLSTNAYRDLATHLAQQGFAIARYDKRGVGKSTIPTTRAPLFADFVDDAAAIVDHFHPRFARLVLVGHSEGGLVALSVGKRPGVAKLVLLATAGRPLGVVLRDQLAGQGDAALLGAYDRLVGQVARGEALTSVPPALQPLFLPSVLPFLRSVATIDPVALVKQLDLPIVVLQGETDIQVKPADAALLAAARPGVARIDVAEANHLFRHEPKATMRQRSYADPTVPFAPSFLPALTKAIGK